MSNINKAISTLEKIGVLGSPSTTTELCMDILGTAVEKKLVGELAFFKYLQEGKENFALGQITDVELRNAWLEDPTMRSLARHKGQVNPISGQQDTHLGKMTLSAVFSESPKGCDPSILGTVPQTGTSILLATDELIEALLEKYKSDLFYLGNVFGSKPKLPLWFKHFGSGNNGAGEAYHIGIFGKTGSGKSVLAKMALCAYMKYPQMGILVVDPQGEFASDFKGRGQEGLRIPLKKIAEHYKRTIGVISVKSLVLDRWELFEEILFESSFFEKLSMPKGDNRRIACGQLVEKLKKAKITLAKLYERTSFDKGWEILKDDSVQTIFYRSADAKNRFNSLITSSDEDEFYADLWKPVCELFRTDRDGARSVEKALSWLLEDESRRKHCPVLVIDLSKEQADGMLWNDKIQALVIKRVLDGLTSSAEHFYKEGKSLNTLVVIDEAHRIAPRENPADETDKLVRNVLVDASRTTRKYGLGWLFISQTLSSIHKEIISQLRINFFGFGLSMGTEFMALKELAGGDPNALKLYQSFRDPHSSFDIESRQYSFMTMGPVSPLSFAGTPLFFTAFNTVTAFLDSNEGISGISSKLEI